MTPPDATTLLLVRHGRTSANAAGHFQGHGGAPLDDVGAAQAAKLGARLARRGADALVASDLERAQQTAAILGEHLGLAVELDERLREVDVGAWSGIDAAEAERRFPDEYAAWRAGVDVPRGGGETYEAAGRRVLAALEDWSTRHAARRLVFVAHGACLQAAGRLLMGLPATARIFWGLRNTGLCELYHGPEGWMLRSWNDTGHLEDP